MANLEISTIGAKIKYAVESTADTRPTTGYTEITDVNSIEFDEPSSESINCCNLTDEVDRFIPGRKSIGEEVSITFNYTDTVISAWGTLQTAATTAWAAGKKCWLEISFSGAANAYYIAILPYAIGISGVEQAALLTTTGKAKITDFEGWATKST